MCYCVTRHVQFFFFFKEIISESLKNHNCFKYVRFQISNKTIRYHYISRPVVVFKCVNIGGETWWSSSVATQLLLYAWTFQGKWYVLKGRFKRNIFFLSIKCSRFACHVNWNVSIIYYPELYKNVCCRSIPSEKTQEVIWNAL